MTLNNPLAFIFIVMSIFVATPVLASSHNEVTSNWFRLFGPQPYDPGGPIERYVHEVAVANKAGTLVVIEGTCMSACTMKLSAKNRCVKLNAVLWFHSASASASLDGEKLSFVSLDGNKILMSAYPPSVRREVVRRHMLESRAFDVEHTLTGSELIRLGERNCDEVGVEPFDRTVEPADQVNRE
jgi:hypothetical protein